MSELNATDMSSNVQAYRIINILIYAYFCQVVARPTLGEASLEHSIELQSTRSAVMINTDENV